MSINSSSNYIALFLTLVFAENVHFLKQSSFIAELARYFIFQYLQIIKRIELTCIIN